MEKTTIGVQGMSCNHCKRAVEVKLKGIDGVSGAMVDLDAANVTVEFDRVKVTPAALKRVIGEAGYKAE
ncbi:MAG: heavy-metal-associated domain-containing protein [Deltaproteobacteria bacterium]|nr:heavy-metal-associated domain-containing protein [Deltaproteobacteria bacterium]